MFCSPAQAAGSRSRDLGFLQFLQSLDFLHLLAAFPTFLSSSPSTVLEAPMPSPFLSGLPKVVSVFQVYVTGRLPLSAKKSKWSPGGDVVCTRKADASL